MSALSASHTLGWHGGCAQAVLGDGLSFALGLVLSVWHLWVSPNLPRIATESAISSASVTGLWHAICGFSRRRGGIRTPGAACAARDHPSAYPERNVSILRRGGYRSPTVAEARRSAASCATHSRTVSGDAILHLRRPARTRAGPDPEENAVARSGRVARVCDAAAGP